LLRSSGTLRAATPNVPLERYSSFCKNFFNPQVVPNGTIIFIKVSNSPELKKNKEQIF
jgi:hypothetical protein